MKLHIVALVSAAAGLPLDPSDGDGPGPGSGSGAESQDCYPVDYTPRCAPGKLCAQVAVPGIACPWKCGEPLPLPEAQACEGRCKPCREDSCAASCACEVVCPVGSDGTGVTA